MMSDKKAGKHLEVQPLEDQNVTGDRRGVVLQNLRQIVSAKTSQHKPARLPARAEEMEWSEIALLAEGLSFANRPLKRATREVVQRFGLGPRGAWILNLIDNGVVHPTVLSTIFQVGRSLITAELVRLTDAGLIVAQPGQHDRRRSELQLTEAGKATCKQIRDGVSAILVSNLHGYTADEIRHFTKMLRDARGSGDTEDEK